MGRIHGEPSETCPDERSQMRNCERPFVEVDTSGHSRIGVHVSALTVELSGARADVWAWHSILHASAPAIC